MIEDRPHRRGLLDERQHYEPTAAARALPQFARSHAPAPRTQGGRGIRARRSAAARGRARCSRAPRRGTWPGARAPPGAAPFPPPSAAASLRQGAKTQRQSTAPTLVRRRRPSPPRPPRWSCAARRATKIRAARRRLRGQIRVHALAPGPSPALRGRRPLLHRPVLRQLNSERDVALRGGAALERDGPAQMPAQLVERVAGSGAGGVKGDLDVRGL